MAQVFECFKGPEFTLTPKDTKVKPDGVHVKETSIDADDEHVSLARELMSYYQSHVRCIGNFIKHHEDTQRRLKESEKSRNALKDRLHNTEEDLRTTKAKLGETEGKLTNTRKELADTKSELSNTRKQLDSTRGKLSKTEEELKNTEKQLDSTRGELSKTADKLKSTETKLDQANTACNEVKLELKSTKELLSKTEAQLQGKQTELDELNGRYTELNDTYTDLKTSYDDVNENLSERTNELETAITNLKAQEAKATKLYDEKTDADKKFNKCEKELNDFRAHKSQPFFTKSNRTAGKYYIDEVVYGGTVIENKSVLDAILKCAAEGKEFKISNKSMGGDTWQGETKSLTVIYAVDGKAPMKYIHKKEGESFGFGK